MSLYKFELDRSSKKYICPSCRENTFVAYVYTANNKIINSEKFGRCDREAKCGAHFNPYQEKSLLSRDLDFRTVVLPNVTQIFPEASLLDDIINSPEVCQGTFYTFCRKLNIPSNHLIRWNVYSQKNKTAFVFRDKDNKDVNVKWFQFDENGHRNKYFKSYSLPQPKFNQSESSINKNLYKYFLCLWGEHLLDPQKKKVVCLVESEKSAVIASFFYPEYDWVSCGSSNGLSDGTNMTADKITPLFGRKIYWICDADKAGRNNSSIKKLEKYELDFVIIDLFPDRTDGYDIADAIQEGLRPKIDQVFNPITTTSPESEFTESHHYNLPAGVDWKSVKLDLLKYSHFEHDGKIYVLQKPKKDAEGYSCKPITNFTIRSIGLIQSESFPRRLIEITNVHGYKKILEIPTRAFASQMEFTVFIESEGNYQYDGNSYDLKKIRSRLYDNMENFEEIEALGWHNQGCFIFANGVFAQTFTPANEFGFVKVDKKNFYIPPLSCINRTKPYQWEDEKKLIYHENNQITLKQWCNIFCEVHRDNGKIALIWFISSLFRDIVYARLRFFPHWFGFGPPTTGKSQVGWSIRAATFSGTKMPFHLSLGTQVAFTREVSQFTNIPCWYDEYDNNIDYSRIQGLKGFYDGSNHSRSIKDSRNRTESLPVLSPCIITGQHLPIADSALFTRVILCQFDQHEYSEEERRKLSDLENLQNGGMPFITTEILRFRKKIEEYFSANYDSVVTRLQNQLTPVEVHTRLVKNMGVLLTMLKVLENDLIDTLPFSFQEFENLAVQNIKNQALLIQQSNETNAFWDMVSYLIDEELIEEGKDYEFVTRKEVKIRTNKETQNIVQFPKIKELLYIRFSRILPLYKEHFNKQNRSSTPLDKSSLIHYLQHSKAFIGSIKNHRFHSSPTTAYVFDNEILKNQEIELTRVHKANFEE